MDNNPQIKFLDLYFYQTIDHFYNVVTMLRCNYFTLMRTKCNGRKRLVYFNKMFNPTVLHAVIILWMKKCSSLPKFYFTVN